MDKDHGKDKDKVEWKSFHNNSPSKRIRFFASFEEAEKADLKYRLQMTPEERLASVTHMLQHIFAHELSQPPEKLKIVFR